MKKIIPLVLAMCFFLSGCAEVMFLFMIGANDEPSQKEVCAYVLAHQQALEKLLTLDIPQDYDAANAFPSQHMEPGTIVESVTRESETVIDFYCGGTGLSTNSTYTGFYYSADDTPYPMVFTGETLIEVEPGVYHWENEDGSHITHSERICENWFYYHVKYY